MLFPGFARNGHLVRDALVLSWAISAVLVSYVALAEAGKYAVPSPAAWIGVEVASGFAQFTLFGVLPGVVHRRPAVVVAPAADPV